MVQIAITQAWRTRDYKILSGVQDVNVQLCYRQRIELGVFLFNF